MGVGSTKSWPRASKVNPFQTDGHVQPSVSAAPESPPSTPATTNSRTHSDAEIDRLNEYGASFIIRGEREIARGMTEHSFERIAAASRFNGSEVAATAALSTARFRAQQLPTNRELTRPG
jgi:hypothetical protein